jgi:hypothetical protein
MSTQTAVAQETPGIIYFCHACGCRLRLDDVRSALARRESHNTVACASCAKQGKCIRNPQQYENQVFQAHKESVNQAAPDLRETAPVAPAPKPVLSVPVAAPSSERRRTQTRIVPAKRTSTRELDVHRTRLEAAVAGPATKRKAPVLVIVGIAVSLSVLAVVLFSGGPKQQVAHANTQKTSVPSLPLPAATPFEQATSRPGSTNETRPAPAQPPLPQPGPAAAGPTVANGSNGEAELTSLELPLNLYLKDKRFGEAFGRWKTLAAAIPANDDKFADWRRKSQEYDRQIREGSQQLLSELQPKAKALSEAGQADELKRMFLPLNLEQLHPDDVEKFRKDEPQWMELALSRKKEADAAREAERAKMRESFEQSLPGVDQLGTLKGRLAFGPDAGPGVQLTEGAGSLHKADGKAAYFDGSKSLTLQKDNFDMIGPGSVILQYSAAQEFSFVLRIYGQQDISSTIRLPAGQLQTKVIAVSNKRASEDGLKMGYRGSWEGRGYGKIKLEFKDIKPGTLALFRISY